MDQRSSLDPADVARFAARAQAWWDPDGAFAPLHKFNPVRLALIRAECLRQFAADPAARAPFAGRRLLDVGCGGGLVSEPMTRLGFHVTGLDAAGEGLEVALAHAESAGLAIDYRQGTIESLMAETPPPFDVVLALEVVEHVEGPARFISDCARLLAPGGLMIASTLNRNLRSLVLAKAAAEYVLRWAPRGAHDWRKFLTPDELSAHFAAAGLRPGPAVGLSYQPLSGAWRISADTRVNYLMTAASPLS